MKNKKNIYIWSAVVIVVIIIILTKVDFSSGTDNAGDSANPSARQVAVNAVIVQPKPLQNIIFSNGTLISNEEVEIRSEISGKITQILFEEGRRVKKNDLLIKINDAELQAT